MSSLGLCLPPEGMCWAGAGSAFAGGALIRSFRVEHAAGQQQGVKESHRRGPSGNVALLCATRQQPCLRPVRASAELSTAFRRAGACEQPGHHASNALEWAHPVASLVRLKQCEGGSLCKPGLREA